MSLFTGNTQSIWSNGHQVNNLTPKWFKKTNCFLLYFQLFNKFVIVSQYFKKNGKEIKVPTITTWLTN